jgi:hypothetical protein
MAAIRYAWMFRMAAVAHLVLGSGAIWRFGFTDYDARHRLWGVAGGLVAVVVGALLFGRMRVAIAISALGAAFVALAAVIAVPALHGPVILLFAGVALLAGCYAVLAARVLLGRTD